MTDLESKIRKLITDELAPAFDDRMDAWFSSEHMGYWTLPYLIGSKRKDWNPLDIAIYAEREADNSGRYLYTESLSNDILELIADEPDRYRARALDVAKALEKLATDIRVAITPENTDG